MLAWRDPFILEAGLSGGSGSGSRLGPRSGLELELGLGSRPCMVLRTKPCMAAPWKEAGSTLNRGSVYA